MYVARKLLAMDSRGVSPRRAESAEIRHRTEAKGVQTAVRAWHRHREARQAQKGDKENARQNTKTAGGGRTKKEDKTRSMA